MTAMVHPRDLEPLERVEAQEATFDAALSRGRLHHAWLLTGPAGLGKTAFAYRAARKLLGPGSGRLIAASSHPDFMVLERETEGGATKRNISVDQARKLPEFFAKAPALGPYRVAIIDTADDLNVNAANAVLKTLEEPSGRGLVFLISNAPGRLLPTIRSRCRRLTFEPWPLDVLAVWLEQAQGLSSEDAARASREAQGSPGRALSLLGRPPSAEAAETLLDQLPALDPAAVQALADGLRGAGGAERFAALVQGWSARARAAALGANDGETGEAWAAAWTRLEALPSVVEGLNLDRADALWTAIGELKAAAIASGRPC